MSIFDSLWSRASRVLDSAVDTVVGDRLRYRHRGVWLGKAPAGYADAVVEGFVLFETAPVNLEGIDEILGSRPRVKIAVALVDEPIQSDRIQHPKLGAGWYRPAGSTPENDGRYWIFDVQEASAP